MHEHLWDDDRSMVRLYGLFLVRETALGAFLDLENGNIERAQRALREVLKHQYAVDSDPRWAGTFKTHAAQPDAGTLDLDNKPRDREWRDYDPNWRQFMAMILEIITRLYGHVLSESLVASLQAAVQLAVRSEPVDRVSPTYSNIALLQAWLCDITTDNANPWLQGVAGQVAVDRDIAEYNSPTYDAVSLLAACLLVDYSRTDDARRLGGAVTTCVTQRISQIWHPRFGLQAGPYSRAYGADPRKYICLMSVLMGALDVPAAGPGRLDENTTHVHDLYFWPVFRRVCGGLRSMLAPASVDQARRYEHRCGEVHSISLLEPNAAIGWETGRRQRFALDQYAPFTYYSVDGFLALRARGDTDWVDVEEVDRHVYRIRTQRRMSPDVTHETAALTVVASKSPVINDNELLFGEVTLQFPGIVIEVRVAPPSG